MRWWDEVAANSETRRPLAPFSASLMPAKGTPEAIMQAAPDLRECYRAVSNECRARQAQGRGVAWLTPRAVAALIGWRDSRAQAAVLELADKGWLLEGPAGYTVNIP